MGWGLAVLGPPPRVRRTWVAKTELVPEPQPGGSAYKPTSIVVLEPSPARCGQFLNGHQKKRKSSAFINPVLRTLWFSLFLEIEEIPLHAEKAHEQVQVRLFPSPTYLSPALWAQSLDSGMEVGVSEGVFPGMSRHGESLSSECPQGSSQGNQVPLIGLQAKHRVGSWEAWEPWRTRRRCALAGPVPSPAGMGVS